MPRIKVTQPVPNKNKGQRSIDIPDVPLYLPRIIPGWNNPGWISATAWRSVVEHQPLAMICRDYLIDNILALDWKIEPRDSEKRDELKDQIKYYTDFLSDTGNYSFEELIEWISNDFLTIPFGGACELGREGDSPDGKVLWIEPLDGGTLFPTYQDDFPVGQTVPEAMRTVYFPKHSIGRIYMSPRTELKRKGWGMAPPEKIYLSIELLNRGDVYYANLLLDTPETGILDLGDMSSDSAVAWVNSWRELLHGIDPFKIPVLYEHEKPINFIPFQRNPTDLMFDKAIARYGAIVTAGYGITLGDIGFSTSANGGETLAGSIRSERRTRKTGLAVLKKKLTFLFNQILPKDLKFVFIDLDDEVSASIGRARLATATAFGQLIDKKMLTPKEGRLQMLADGLINISIPEDVPMDEFPAPAPNPFNPLGNQPNPNQPNKNQPPERPNMLGRPVAPSAGGQGEVRSFLANYLSNSVDNTMLLRCAHDVYVPMAMEYHTALRSLGTENISDWNDWHDSFLFSEYSGDLPEITRMTLSSSLASVGDDITKVDLNPLDEYLSEFYRSLLTIFDKEDELDYSIPKTMLRELMTDAICRLSLSVIRGFLINTDGDTFETLLLDNDFVVTLRQCYNKSCYTIADIFLSKLYDIISQNNRKEYINA